MPLSPGPGGLCFSESVLPPYLIRNSFEYTDGSLIALVPIHLAGPLGVMLSTPMCLNLGIGVFGLGVSCVLRILFWNELGGVRPSSVWDPVLSRRVGLALHDSRYFPSPAAPPPSPAVLTDSRQHLNFLPENCL